MINLKIGDKKVELPNDWSEITIENYARLLEIYARHNCLNKDEQESDEQFNADNVKANMEALAFLTKVDIETIKKCKSSEVNNVLGYMTKFLSEVDEKTFEEVDDKKLSFTFKNKTYFYPEFKFKDTTFGDYIEAAQLNNLIDKQKGGRFAVLPEQIAILCKEVDEQSYDEKLIRKKTKLFEKLPMSYVWDFVFFLTKQTMIWEKNFRTFSKTGTELETDIQEKTGI
jgi:hypothetical protein